MPGGLARALKAPGGLTVKAACRRAAVHLEVLAEQGQAALRECIDSIAERVARGAPGAETRAQMHELACTVAGLGGMFGRDALSKAGYNFCRLLDETEPKWNSEAAALHVNAMRLLMAPERVPVDYQVQIISGLNKVRVRAAPAPG
jgi:hypothetical protein